MRATTAELHAERHDPLGPPDLPTVAAGALPWITAAQMREVDRLTTDEIGISLEQMMENAGRALASAAARLLGGAARRSVVVLAGPGGNGGGGMVAARHLLAAGAAVEVRLGASRDRVVGMPRLQLEILEALGLAPRAGRPDMRDADLVLDALLGYGQAGSPQGDVATLIRWTAGRRTLSLDVPSGLELSRGTLLEPHVVAEATVTLALPKRGLNSAPTAGRLLLADISVPAVVYERLGIAYRTPFGGGPLVEIV